MQMGRRLLDEMNLDIKQLNHQTFVKAYELIQEKGETYFNQALEDVQNALENLYGQQTISLQQLSATFRRGDLIEKLEY